MKKMYRFFAFLLLGVLIAGFCTYLPGYSSAIGIVFLGLMLGILCAKLVAAQGDSGFLLSIFLTGFLLRIFLSVGLYVYCLPFGYFDGKLGFQGFFIEDGWGYYHNGLLLNNFWQSGFFPNTDTFHLYYSHSRTASAYDYLNGLIVTWLGKSPLVLFFLNSLLGALSIILIYLICLRLIGKGPARYAAIFYCFWPSIVLWSTQNLKEPICSFLIYLGLLGLLTLSKKFSPWYILWFILCTFGLLKIRPPLAATMGMIFFVFFISLILGKRNKVIFITGGLILGLGIFWFLRHYPALPFVKGLIFKEGRFDVSYLLNSLNYTRTSRAFGGSAIMPGLEYKSLFHLLAFMPVGLILVFFAPFPWQLGSAMQLMAFPETLIWYVLFPFSMLGVVHSFRNNRHQTTIIVAYILMTALILGLGEGNIGTLFRHRSIIMGLCLIFAGIGMKLRKKEVGE
jgi:hypothetical protein